MDLYVSWGAMKNKLWLSPPRVGGANRTREAGFSLEDTKVKFVLKCVRVARVYCRRAVLRGSTCLIVRDRNQAHCRRQVRVLVVRTDGIYRPYLDK